MTEENEMRVAMTFVNSPKKSTRRAAQELSFPRTSLRRLNSVKQLKTKYRNVKQLNLKVKLTNVNI